MSVFLIDYENVRATAFNGLENLSESDKVIVFYTNNSDNLTFSLMQRLNESKAEIEYKKVNCGGKNSLDFQLCSYLEYLIGTCSDTRFCIVSRDKGFFTMLSLWGENAPNGNTVICCSNLFNGMGQATEENETSAEADILDAPAESIAMENTAEEAAKPEQQETNDEEAVPETKPRRRRTYKRKPKTAVEQTA